jgi:hypothetical protein
VTGNREAAAARAVTDAHGVAISGHPFAIDGSAFRDCGRGRTSRDL